MTYPASADIVAKLRTLRKIQKISARLLAETITNLGYPISRGVIANIEASRTDTVPVEYLVYGARALGTTPEDVLTMDVPTCPQCKGEPPEGFTCNTCGDAR